MAPPGPSHPVCMLQLRLLFREKSGRDLEVYSVPTSAMPSQSPTTLNLNGKRTASITPSLAASVRL